MQRHEIGKAGRKSEKKLTKKLGGRETPASGAMQGAKGDIDLDTVLMEAKSTLNASFSIKHEHLSKIAREARRADKSPALSVSFVNQEGKAHPDGEWVLVPMWLWKDRLL